jgi:hypothetical protein
MTIKNSIADLDRSKFLEKLVAASRGVNGLLLCEFEVEFLASFQRYNQYHTFFNAGSGGRRNATDHMWRKFGSEPEIKMPFPLAESSKPKLDQADPNCCEFLVRESGVQRPCNEPGEKVNRNGFIYCRMHVDLVLKNLKRRGGTMHLTDI